MVIGFAIFYEYFIHDLNQERLYFYQKQNYINNGTEFKIQSKCPLLI